MSKRVVLALALVSVAGACGPVRESRFNPFNWFGQDRSEAAAAPAEERVDARPFVDRVISVNIERVSGGIIVRATGLPPWQGYYDVALTPLNDDLPGDGVLRFAFRAFPPEGPTRAGTASSRELLAGIFVSAQDLAAVRVIEVVGAENKRSVRWR